MAFGLNIDPRIYTKLVEAIVQQKRNRSLHVMVYLDDCLVYDATKLYCLRTAQEVMKFQKSLGFQVNLEKSRISKAREFQWLGLHWNLESHNLTLTQGKRNEITQSARDLLHSRVLTRQKQERVGGHDRSNLKIKTQSCQQTLEREGIKCSD
ncbi:uncharacterized protein [Palaemon carinicauda]|uniref:uncharacterized protein n=1 Tax=Palaemon carinicauda TaxID=392227 RepID=UPI0035B627DB